MEGSVFLRAWPPIVNTYFFRYKASPIDLDGPEATEFVAER
jgi:hypothetical protein